MVDNLIPQHLLRQADSVPLDILKTKITIIGAGAIGSFTCLSLAKMGFQDIEIWDFDKVDTVNMSSQFYRLQDIGNTKADAIHHLVADFTGVGVKAKNRRYEPGDRLEGIVICAVDSMKARRDIFETHKLLAREVPFVIDPRMAIEDMALYTYVPVNFQDCERYEKTLHNDADAVQDRCTGKATMFTVNLIAGMVCRTVRDILVKQDHIKSLEWSVKFDDFTMTRTNGKFHVREQAKVVGPVYAAVPINDLQRAR